jgi:LAO/AO transport system kinase
LPGAGDSLQGIKRGILEITDILVINKADGELKNLAKIAADEYQSAFHLLKPKYDGIYSEIVISSALQNEGIHNYWEKITLFCLKLKEKNLFEINREKQLLNWFKRLAEDAWLKQLWEHAHSEELINQVKTNELTPIQAAQKLINAQKKYIR